MSDTRRIKLKGYLYWAKVFEHNRDMEGFEGVYRDHNGACTVNLHMDEANKNFMESTGCMLQAVPSEEHDGYYVAKFKRKFEEEPYNGGAPKVKDIDGDIWDSETLIGNGSYGAVVVSIYPVRGGKNRKGHRLEEVHVYDLIPYEGGGIEIEEAPDSPAEKVSKRPTKDNDEGDSPL